jgi:hypothetical protein
MAADSTSMSVKGKVGDFLSSQDDKEKQLRRVVKPKVCKPAVAFAGQMVQMLTLPLLLFCACLYSVRGDTRWGFCDGPWAPPLQHGSDDVSSADSRGVRHGAKLAKLEWNAVHHFHVFRADVVAVNNVIDVVEREVLLGDVEGSVADHLVNAPVGMRTTSEHLWACGHEESE